MNQQLAENEISKILDNLNYPSQADIMKQQLFFIQTETIRLQRINDERVVEALMNIAANNPNGPARKEAGKTLKYLGITPLPINSKLAQEVNNWPLIGLIVGIIPGLIVSFSIGMWLSSILFPVGILGGMIGAAIGNAVGKKSKDVVLLGAIAGAFFGSCLGFAFWGQQ